MKEQDVALREAMEKNELLLFNNERLTKRIGSLQAQLSEVRLMHARWNAWVREIGTQRRRRAGGLIFVAATAGERQTDRQTVRQTDREQI